MGDNLSGFFEQIIVSIDAWARTSGITALVIVVVSLIVAAAFLLLVLRHRLQTAAMAQHQLQQQLDESRTQAESLKQQFERLQQSRQQADIDISRLDTLNQSLQAELARSDDELDRIKGNYGELQTGKQSLELELTRLKTSYHEKQHQFEDQIKLLNDAKQQMKQDFELLANEILENKGRAFREINQQSIQSLLSPVQAEMKGFREKVESLHTEETKQRSELKAELLHLQKLNQDITDQASQLTNALQGQKKVQGNWGELILENVLDSSGLRKGDDYQREVSFKTEDGRKRPDAIVHLPQDKHLVIDAKTSLAAYTRYVNAANDLERETALAEHAAAISDRINELADKDYYRLPGLNSPEVVIMFIPIESAYVEALKYDDTLYQKGIERNVLVATPTTLLTSLNIVRQLWQFEDRNKHTAELANRAEKFYNKLNSFLASMQKVGDQLDNARQTYDQAVRQLYSGRGNLIKQAAEFKDLGVSVQKELPEEFVEKAKLELDDAKVIQLDSKS
jgi:DNA recombination protein RmuC